MPNQPFQNQFQIGMKTTTLVQTEKSTINLSNKTCLVYDFGLFTEQAARLARDFGRVYYFCPWQDAFPKIEKSLIGQDFDGLIRISSFWDYVDEADIIFVPDTHTGDLVEFLKSKGYKVVGPGKAEILELNRILGRKVQKELGLPTQETYVLKGLEKLREFLKNTKEQFFIKLNTFRGTIETFRHIDYESSEPLLDHIAYESGPEQHILEFIAEKALEGIEPGGDHIFSGDSIFYPTMYGFELKGAGYIGKIVDEKNYPEPLKKIDDALSIVLEELNYSFFYSTEVIVTKDKKGYLIDPCIRLAAPVVSALQTELIENYSEVVYGLATGEKIQPRYKAKYGGGVAFESEWAQNHWLKVSFPKELRQWIKLRMAMKFNDAYYAVPGFTSICSVIAIGNSPEEVFEQVKERSEKVKAYLLEKNLSGLEQLKKIIKDAKDYGIDF
jgi:hypothetical protein